MTRLEIPAERILAKFDAVLVALKEENVAYTLDGIEADMEAAVAETRLIVLRLNVPNEGVDK